MRQGPARAEEYPNTPGTIIGESLDLLSLQWSMRACG
jgi:hypothetical protein